MSEATTTPRAVGIFDSGVGGLAVLRELRRRQPGCPFIYYGDTARLPYGEKPPELIQQYACENADFLLQRGATALVIACNSASACAADLLRRRFAVPVYDAISPTAAAAAAATVNGKIALIGTPATVRSGAYQRALQACDAGLSVEAYATPLFVPLIEEQLHRHEAARLIARHYLEPIVQGQADTLVLGCTHYTLIEELLRSLLPDGMTIIDSALCCARQLPGLPAAGADEDVAAVQLHFSAQMLHWQSFIDYFCDATDRCSAAQR